MGDLLHCAGPVETAVELEGARAQFHAMLASLAAGDWERPSANRSWTNGQLLVHITFAYLLVLRLWRVMQLFGHLPRSWSRAFARLLDWSTPFYQRINAVLPRLGTRLYGPDALARRYDRIHSVLLRRLSSVGDAQWRSGMHYPTRWDARFRDFMTLEDITRWSVLHLQHHRQQLKPSRVTPA